MAKLSAKQVQDQLKGLSGWELKDETIQREFILPSFSNAILFISAVGQLAEAAGHHPDIHLFAYNHVRLILTTHSSGGLTKKDLNLASQIQGVPLQGIK